VETPDTGADDVDPDPRCSWKGHSRRVGAGVGDDSAEYGTFSHSFGHYPRFITLSEDRNRNKNRFKNL